MYTKLNKNKEKYLLLIGHGRKLDTESLGGDKRVYPKVCVDPLKRPCANNKVVCNHWAKMRYCDMKTDNGIT